LEGRTIAITGQIDLLFGEDTNSNDAGPVTVVDFKTDRIENPEDHYAQLAAYFRAVEDIFARPVSVWLYYLRSGRAVDVTEAVKRLSLEKVVEGVLLHRPQ